MRLNDALIANEKYRGEPTTDEEGRTQWPPHILWDDELQGFGLRIYPSVRGRPSRKDFIVTWKTGLRTRTMAIGTYGPGCSLRQARKIARDAIDLARRGQDPIEARHRALGIGTPEDLASRFLFEHNAAKKKPGIPGGGDPMAEPNASPDAAPDALSDATEASAADATESAAPAEVPDAALSPAPVPVAEGAASAAPPSAAAVESPLVEPEEDEPAVDEDLDSRVEKDAEIDAAVASLTAAPPAAPATPRSVETPRRAPAAPPPAPVKRGPTKVRLLPVPESLYRVIEHGARESEMTIAAYLNALVEIARAAVGENGSEPAATDDGATPEPTGPSIRELFSQVQEAQAVEVGGSSDDREDDSLER